MKTFQESKACIDMEKLYKLLTTGELTIQELSDICNLHPTRITYLFNILEARKNVTIIRKNILSGRQGSPNKKYSIKKEDK